MNNPFLKKGTKILILIFILSSALAAFAVLYEKYKINEFSSLIEADPYYVSDEITGHGHTTNHRFAMPWPESDSISKQTNNLGFVKKEITGREKPDSVYRILVAGDSHVDGAVCTNENFPNLLESELKKHLETKDAEVLNAGVGFYSFQNYLGVIKKYKFLKPDLYIVTVYTGNDFIEGYLYEEENQKAFSSLQTFWYRLKKGFFQMRTGMASTQSTNQLLFFNTFPEKKEKALAIAQEEFIKIRQQCDEMGIKLLVVLLPSKLESEKVFYKDVASKSNWNDQSLNTNIELSNGLESWLITQKIKCINATDTFKKSEQKLFWDTDQHLNKTGHSLLAKIVLENYKWQKSD